MAKHAFDFIARSMTKGDRLGHSWRDGKLLFPGLASDFAAMIRAALALYEATGERPTLSMRSPGKPHSMTYAHQDTGWYYLSADDASDLLLRPHSTQDDAIPNSNAVAAQNLVRLAALTGDEKCRRRPNRSIKRSYVSRAKHVWPRCASQCTGFSLEAVPKSW